MVPRKAMAVAAAAAAALLGLVAVASSVHHKSVLIGGIQMGGTYEYAGMPRNLNMLQQQMPESWVQPGDGGRPLIMEPNAGPMQYIPQPRIRSQRMGLAGQAQMPESWVGQSPQAQPVVVQPNSGNYQYRPTPSAKGANKAGVAKMQKLWSFNMGYEHHEQPPIYFGSARKENNVGASMAVAPTAAREMQLWGWPKQMMAGKTHANKKATAPHANKAAATQSKMQKLWMFNMGYEHHEQPPIYFGSARKENNVGASM